MGIIEPMAIGSAMASGMSYAIPFGALGVLLAVVAAVGCALLLARTPRQQPSPALRLAHSAAR